jgi:hypothetical protein
VAALRQTELWRQLLRSPAFALYLVAVALCLVRARDQPSVDVGIGGTTVSIVLADIAVLLVAIVSLVILVRTRDAGAPWVVAAAAAFCAILLATAAANGMDAFVSAAKFVELAALGLGGLVLVRTRGRLDALVDLLIVFTLVADVVALVEFVRAGGGRQASFLGEHDFAALATLPLVYGLASLFDRRASGRRAAAAIVVGAIGVSLGAALASLVGLYLGVVVLFVVVVSRHALQARATVVTVVVVAAVTTATLLLRSGDLGFIQQWFGKPPQRPGQYAASWSQRLIYVYIGGRVFLDHPVLGTGWWGELPEREFVRYLPDARRRFSDQPRRYFPPATRRFIPQQAYDQVLYELGLVGAAAFAAFLVALGARCVAAARHVRGWLAYLPAVWLAATVGAIAGEGFFGGTPLAAVFWLSAGVVAAIPLVVDG